jgi:hypothetical protein
MKRKLKKTVNENKVPGGRGEMELNGNLLITNKLWSCGIPLNTGFTIMLDINKTMH